jgi:hypothetical protein
MLFAFPSSGDQMEIFQSLFRMYALILTSDPAIDQETVPAFSMELLNNLGNRIVSISGVEFELHDINGKFILRIILLPNGPDN